MARRKEKAAAAHAGEQAAKAMAMATQDTLVRPGTSGVSRGHNEDADDWWYYEAQAVRMARMAAYHGFRARPDIKPPDSYDRAVAQYRAQHRTAPS